MGLKPLSAALRNVHVNASGPTRVLLVLPPGDELVVSEGVAKQLTDQSPQLVDVTPAETPAPQETPAKAAAAKKAAAKPKD
jgi:hypothetical protein